MGAPTSVASIPQMGLTDPIDALDRSWVLRLRNAASYLAISHVIHHDFIHQTDQWLVRHGYASWYDLPVGLLCIPSEIGLISARLVPSNWFYVGPLLAGSYSPLEQQVREFVESASNGAIFVTFGTLFGFPTSIETSIIDGLAKLADGWVVVWKVPAFDVQAIALRKHIASHPFASRYAARTPTTPSCSLVVDPIQRLFALSLSVSLDQIL
jgi:hypothetical protein